MNKKIKTLIAIGGTGGHVFPGYNLAEHLDSENYNIQLVTDIRGTKYLKGIKDFKTFILPSNKINRKNLLTLFFSSLLVIYAIIRSFIFLLFNRPSIIFGMGGYASFPICIAASVLRIKFIIYENNLIIGKANKYLMPFANKIFISNEELEGIPFRYKGKIIKVGNIIKKEIINYSKNKDKNYNFKIFQILVLGGSQAAHVFAEILPKIFQKCSRLGIPLKIFQHCLPSQNNELKLYYKNYNIDCEIFNFSHNLTEYFSKVNLAITRSGSSILAELTNANIPFISVPLPSSADNHQLKNGIYYCKKKFSFLIEEKDLNDKLFSLIKELYNNNSVLNEIIFNQRQYSDKNVYKNISQALKKILHEKN